MDIVTIPAYHTANSYVALMDANSYISSHSKASYAWGVLSESQQQYALILAAQALNTFGYRGRPVTKNQTLAFPRYPDSLRTKTQLDTFFDITYNKVVEDENFEIVGNRIISGGSVPLFFDAFGSGNLLLDRVVRVSGISAPGTYDYLTVVDIDPVGEWIQVKETLADNANITLSIWTTDIFGVPKNVEYAQTELAVQVVNTKMFQQEVGETPEPPIQSFYLTGALSVRYVTEITRRSKFEDSGPLDIIYNQLNPWMAGIKGAIV